MTFLKFPGRNHFRASRTGVSRVTSACRIRTLRDLVGSTRAHRQKPGWTQQGPPRSAKRKGASTIGQQSPASSADLGGQLADDVAQTVGNLCVLPRMLAV